MKNMDVSKKIKKKFNLVSSHLNEKTRRLWATTEAQALGRGGATILSAATNVFRSTIYLGLKALKSKKNVGIEKVRKSEGGRKNIIERNCL